LRVASRNPKMPENRPLLLLVLVLTSCCCFCIIEADSWPKVRVAPATCNIFAEARNDEDAAAAAAAAAARQPQKAGKVAAEAAAAEDMALAASLYTNPSRGQPTTPYFLYV